VFEKAHAGAGQYLYVTLCFYHCSNYC